MIQVEYFIMPQNSYHPLITI